MIDKRTEREQKMFDTLKKIAKAYMTTAKLRKQSNGLYGLEYEEALEMAYENIQRDAAEAIRGMRRPTPSHPKQHNDGGAVYD